MTNASHAVFTEVSLAEHAGAVSAENMTDPISVTFLRDVQHGGSADQLPHVADQLARFIATATQSVDVAIYDFRLSDTSAADAVVGALRDATERGVSVRIGYDAGKPARADFATFAMWEADPAPRGTQEWVREHFADTMVRTRAITGGHQLMHSKYVVRDAGTADAGVWTGSANFTDDAWTRQENNIIVIADTGVSSAYRDDFDQLWDGGAIAGTGRGSEGSNTIAGGTLGWDFCPGDGGAVNSALTARIAAATERIIVASMVLTSHEILTALADALDRGITLSGIYDGGQMDPIVRRWEKNPHDVELVATWTKVSANLRVKHSTPYTPSGPHNFMHLKVMVSDDTLTTGSYNFSANAERNAENQIHLTDPTTVNAYTDYLNHVIEAYR
ncbi:MAG: phospholipase D-like domain-containing protein [Pseudonocardiaceae bacterium]